MTSSNENFRRSRVFSYLAGGLTALGLAGMGVLVFQVNDLSDRYGLIERDIGYFTDERDRLRQNRDQLGQEISRFDTDLQASREELRLATQSREEARSAEAAALAARNTAQAALEQLRAQERAALETIATADRERERISSLTVQREGIETAVAALDILKGDLEQTVSGLNVQRATLTGAVEGLLGQRATATSRVEALGAEIVGLEALRAEVAQLRLEETGLRERSAQQQADAGSLESSVTGAQERLVALQAQVKAETAARDTAARERGRAEGELGTLIEQLDALSRDQGDLQRVAQEAAGRLRQSEAARQAADDARLQAETALTEAREALAQATTERSSAQAARDAAVLKRAQIEGDIERGSAKLTQVEMAETQIAQLTGQRDALTSEVEGLRTDRASLGVQAELANDELQKARDKIAAILARTGVAEAQAAERLFSLQEAIGQAEARFTVTSSALEDALRALNEDIAERDSAISVLAATENKLGNLNQQIASRETVLAEIEAAEARIDGLNGQISSLRKDLRTMRTERGELQQQLETLEQNLKPPAASQGAAEPALDGNQCPEGIYPC